MVSWRSTCERNGLNLAQHLWNRMKKPLDEVIPMTHQEEFRIFRMAQRQYLTEQAK